MAGNKIKTFSIVEWFVLAIVILATLSLQPTPEEPVEVELESTKITGTVELSTRSAMNSLGLDDFKLGPLATVDLISNPVISKNCLDCLQFYSEWDLQQTIFPMPALMKSAIVQMIMLVGEQH